MKLGSGLHKKLENSFNTWCIVFGLLLALLSFVHGIGELPLFPDFPPTRNGEMHAVNDIMTKLGLLIAAIGLSVALREAYIKNSSKKKLRHFQEFFGKSAIEDSLRLVHAKRSWGGDDNYHSPSAQKVKKKLEKILGKNVKLAPKGIGHWLTAENNFAATAIATLFSNTTKAGLPRIIYDSFVEDDTMPFCVVSLGLGFNQFTHVASDMTRNMMFRVVFKECVKKGKGCDNGANEELAQNSEIERTENMTDEKLDQNANESTIQFTDEFVLPCFESGSSGTESEPEKFVWKYPKPAKNLDVAMILRIPYKTSEDSDYSTRFVVAGRSATGTAAAGFYLANHWEELHRLYFQSDPGQTDGHKSKEDIHGFGKRALLVVLEHKTGLEMDGSNVVLTSGTQFYCGKDKYEALSKDDVGSDEIWADFEDIDIKNAERFKEYARSIYQNGYGFYDPDTPTEAAPEARPPGNTTS